LVAERSINNEHFEKNVYIFDVSILALVAKTMFNHCRRKSKVNKTMLDILVLETTTPKKNYKSII